MKKFNAIIFCILTIALLSSCDSNKKLEQAHAEKAIKKLEQANAEKAIKEFVQTNSFGGKVFWAQKGSFDVNSISSIEPVSQFSETEASSIVYFNYHDAFADGNLVLKFNFKKNMDKYWVLTSVDEVSGVGSQEMHDRLIEWQNISIMTQ